MLCILEYKGAIDDTLTPAELVTLRIMKNLYHPYILTLIIDIIFQALLWRSIKL